MEKTEQPGKVVIYCRVSSTKQVKEGNGLDGQEQGCRAWARQHGLVVERVFCDAGVSGAKDDRPALNEMLDFLEKTPNKYIALFYDISRIARDTELFWAIHNQIVAKGHKVETTQERLENTPIGKFLATIQAAHSQLFREENAARAKANMVEHAKQGYWVLQPPTGYLQVRIDKRIHLKRCEPTASYLQNALEGFADGKYPTQKAVFDYLSHLEVVGPYKKSIRVTMNFVKNLLTNPKYTGYFEYSHWNIPYQKWMMEPIIDVETYHRIQDKLNGKKTVKPHKYNVNDEDFPLRRFVRCAVCGEKLTASRPKGKAGKHFSYYHCHKRGCPMCGKGIKPEIIHSEFERVLENMTPAPEMMNLAMEITKSVYAEQNNAEIANKKALDKAIRDKEEQKTKTFEILVKSDDNADVVQMCNTRISELSREITELKAKLENSEEEQMPLDFALDYVKEFVGQPVSVWRAGDYYKKQGVLNLCFAEQISYDRVEKFRTPKLSPIFAVFNKNLGDENSWRTQKDSNPQSSDP